jgi:hypothetical protein
VPVLGVEPDGLDGHTPPLTQKTPTNELIDDDDDLRPARGFVAAVLLALPMWGAIGLMIWFVLG